MTYFQTQDAARRYARYRLYFHPQVMHVIRQTLGLTGWLPHALDVGCGTGQSTRALRLLAEQVTGLDASDAMLAEAEPCAGVQYVKGNAEALPFADQSLPLVTVGQAFHWFQRRRFLRECSRVLSPHGHLVIYTHQIEHLGLQFFARTFPAPYQEKPLLSPELEALQFELVLERSYTHDVQMDLTELVGYLLSTSGAEERLKDSTLTELEQEIRRELASHFEANQKFWIVSQGKAIFLKKLAP